MFTKKEIGSVADFVVQTLVACGGVARYSRYYKRGEALLDELGLESFWGLDIAIALLEEAGVVQTEATTEPMDDTHYDYTITLLGEPRQPWLNLKGRYLSPEYCKMPKGLKLIEVNK